MFRTLLLGASAKLTLDAGNSSANGKSVSSTPDKGMAVIELETSNAAGEVEQRQP